MVHGLGSETALGDELERGGDGSGDCHGNELKLF
jgi:hypothetical protein